MRWRRLGLALGPAGFAALLFLPEPDGLSAAGWRVAGLGVWMIAWWATEPVPLAVTALLPILVLPLAGVSDPATAAAPFADPVVFLFLGGFLLALAMQRWGLHRRIALTVVGAVRTPRRLVGAFMVATAFISMWVNNTATMLMMLPIALSVVEREEQRSDPDPSFGPSLLLGVVYATAIGGLGTVIGTPPNALLVGFLESSYGIQVSFLEWMRVGVPLVVILLPVSWILVTRFLLPLRTRGDEGARDAIREELRGLGPITRAEWTVAAVFLLTDALWMGRPWLLQWLPGLSDAGIAIGGALVLFVLPSGAAERGAVMDWKTAVGLPWEVLILFGGGLSLSSAVAATGLGEWMGAWLSGPAGWPPLLAAVFVGLALVVISEFASNTAAAITFLPVVASVAVAAGDGPLSLTFVAALAASGGFILPVASPPNAIAYGTGRITLRQMVRGGVCMDALFALILPVAAYLLVSSLLAATAGP